MSICIKTTDEQETPIYKMHIYKSKKTQFRDFKITNKYLMFRYIFNRFSPKIVLRYAITKSRRRVFRFHSYNEACVYGTFEAYVKTEEIPRLSNM